MPTLRIILRHILPAIDVQCSAGDEAVVFGGEIGNRPGDIVRRSGTAERNLVLDGIVGGLVSGVDIVKLVTKTSPGATAWLVESFPTVV